jgi:phosphoglycolate phosphatase-like HAD superfamily hydrolase
MDASSRPQGDRVTPSIILDFDGTIAVGPGPVLAYARLLAPDARPGFLDRVTAALAAHEAGSPEHRDGYDVVGSLARADHVPADALADAYLASRALLGTPQAPVSTLPDLPAFLADLRRHARVVLATNAPQVGIDRVLAQWGATTSFDAQHFTVGKPAGLVPVLRDALADGPVLAVGDVLALDLAPALDLGADTALVGPTAATTTATVTMRAATLADLRTDLQTWAAAAASSTPTPVGVTTRIER